MKTEFKIGDRVRVKASGFKQNLHSFDIERLTPNLVGTLIAEEGEKLLIKFDGFKYGHSARNHFEERRLPYNPEDTCYWFVNSNQIEKVEE